MRTKTISICLFAFTFHTVARLCAQPGNGRIEITIVNPATHKLLPCRMYLKNGDGKPVRAENLPNRRDHFVCPGQVQLDLTGGSYSYEIERGPEFLASTGSFPIFAGATNKISVVPKRFIDLAAEG